jgi:hypothetical protein
VGKLLVRFCEGPGDNEWQEVEATRLVLVACDEAFRIERLASMTIWSPRSTRKCLPACPCRTGQGPGMGTKE